ncbi:hypothetical protein DPMN_083146 [Dreissena polymorpha]|uniref:Uncharacterized protein n=1 Tax=Dreissena polymorpha TaxID=45954 RepID=A0A9D3Y8A3_DREPO|nr:hypothetical protein DPMN_083146 [Dreissena polymorpha]
MVNSEAKSHNQARNNLVQEYSSSQPHLKRLQLDLSLTECSEACLLYEVSSWLKRGQENGDSVHTTIMSSIKKSPDFDTTRKRWNKMAG